MIKQVLKAAVLAGIAFLAAACGPKTGTPAFVRAGEGQFIRNGQPYTFIGTNFWYGPILASDGEGGDLDRLARELDTLKSLGIDNLRVLVGGDGPDGVFSRVEPTLQKAPGVYNDTLLTGLDRFLVELGKRDMQAVLYLNNSWEWSGGYGQYLEWATGEPALIPLIDGYWPFMQQMAKFSSCEPAQQLFFDHLKAIVGRTNSLTGKPYSEDPAIFSWQIGNEPRCFSDDPEVRKGFIGWLTEAARLIKEIDPNHLVSTGNEGLMGCESDPALLEEVAAIPGIDYMTIHIWPYNWSWVRAESLVEDLPSALEKTDDYVRVHVELAERYGLPLVVEEFGFPRDGFSPERSATTVGRDAYYSHLFAKVGRELDGANFWGWSGFAQPSHTQWERGDDYAGDPAQEAQGLNGVYVDDTTVGIIRQFSLRTPKDRLVARLRSHVEKGEILYGHQDDLSYGHAWKVEDWETDSLTRSDVKAVTGMYPAVVGFDLGGIEMGDRANLDSVDFGLIRKAALLHAERGGIVTFSWHPRNPLTGGDAWDVSSDRVVESLLEGGELHDLFMDTWLKRLGDFLESLEGTPVIFRPWHEHLGSWFWWGGKLCTEQQYKDLYRTTWTYLVKTRGLDNIVWCYSPNSGVSADEYMSRYPDDGFVDLLGLDHYEYVGPDGLKPSGVRFAAEVERSLTYMIRLANDHHKLMCLSETGLEGLGDPAWWTRVLYPAIRDYPIAYVLTWRNAHDKPGHFYAAWEGFENASDMKAFSQMDGIVFMKP